MQSPSLDCWLRLHPLTLGLALAGCSSKPLPADAAAGGAAAGGAASGGASTETPKPETLTIFGAIRISSNPDAEYHQRADTAVDFGTQAVSQATLRVKLESPCFPFEQWTLEQIPAGHSWPKLCDAYDRLIAVTLDDPPDTASGPPAFELSRAVTPFGGPMTFETDVTDFVNGLPGPHRLRVDIGTWGDPDGLVSGSEGEWGVTVELVTQRGPAPRRVLAVVPLLAGSETAMMPASIPFEVPEGATSGRIAYTATGHGGGAVGLGCIGPAEEFCQRTHTLFVDAQPVSEFSPWRADCASLCTVAHHEASDVLTGFDYCQENPCGSMASVRASRANWCPGSPVSPHVVTSLTGLSAGPHEFSLAVDTILAGGLWQLSATYFAFE